MSFDRTWINRRIVPGYFGFTEEYSRGVDNFLEFASRNCTERNKEIRCPCVRCKNLNYKCVDDVKFDLYANGFLESYTVWTFHGENVGGASTSSTSHRDDFFDPFEMLRDAAGPSNWNNFSDDGHEDNPTMNWSEEPNEQASQFYHMVEGAGVPIYPGNKKFTKLSFVTKLLYFKNSHGCSDRGFDELLTLVGDVLPEEHTLPKNYYEVKKLVKGLNLGYNKIDACQNDCMLFYGADSERQECRYCHLSRFKDAKSPGGSVTIPRKILRYFPLIPRLQRLYMSSRTAEDMKWYKNREVTEGILTHPADGEEWKEFDRNFPDFAAEIRNVRIGLATDGFSPYSNTYSQPYSVWPVVMVVYNLPPSMCMKDAYMFMTLLIPGEKSPTRDINVYLRPLIDELNQLWHVGVQTYDASSKRNFTLRAALLWTINDFPALGMVSGWSTHGKLSCPVCIGDAKGMQLPHSRKCSFWGTSKQFIRRRKDSNRRTGREVRKLSSRLCFPPPGKLSVKDRADGFGDSHNWTHLTIFFELPYWDTLRLRHCIDVMHTEKNVFDNVFHTVIGSDKSKDTKNARADLKAFNIRNDLWLRASGVKPRASYTLNKEQLLQLCLWVSNLKLPDGYASNIARCSKVTTTKFQGMKSHDCHVFMQKLLPSAFRELLPHDVHTALCDLSNFFQGISSTVLLTPDLLTMRKNIVTILCTLETIFPPSFFDSMEHLPIHLPDECILGGPVQYRWMYPFERLMRRMKMKVGNKARVEGSIAEKYTQEELLHFCSLYFESTVQTVHNRLGRNVVDDESSDVTDRLEAFTYPTRPFGKSKTYNLDEHSFKIVSDYVFFNMPEVIPYRETFEEETYASSPNITSTEMDTVLSTYFRGWLHNKLQGDVDTYKLFEPLIRGPATHVISYSACLVNGYRFKCEHSNSGVLVKGSCYGDSVDNYYGRLEEVLKLTYDGGNQLVLFKCHWYDNTKAIKIDRNKITTIDVTSKLKSDDVYILASQATQVYYAPSVKNPNSSIHTVITTKSRPLDESTSIANEDALQEDVSNATIKEIPALSLFVDFSQYQDRMRYEPSHVDVDDEVEFQSGEEDELDDEDIEEDELDDENSEEDGYDDV